jgi:hypothetical protein
MIKSKKFPNTPHLTQEAQHEPPPSPEDVAAREPRDNCNHEKMM